MRLPGLFGRLKAAVVGVVHVGALPGTPRSSFPLTQIIDQACQEAEAYKDAGVDGLIVENMHDLPYTVCPGLEVTAVMSVFSAALALPWVSRSCVLQTKRRQRLLLLQPACGCPDSREDEERQPKHSTRWITNVCADGIHSVRSCCLQCSCPDVSMAAELSLAEGLVLTRTVTAVPTEPQELKEVKHAVKIPVMIWSGVTLENVRNYLDADTLIIGSYFQKEGYWANHVDPDRVKKFMEHISKLRE